MYKKFILGKKAVCFDLDGTLADTEAYFVMAFSKILEKVNADLFYGDVYGPAGIPVKNRWERLIKEGAIEGNADELARDTTEEYLKFIDGANLQLKEGFWEIIYKLKEKELKTVLTTNTKKDVAMKVLEKLDIVEAFDFAIFGDDVKNPKPNPEIYTKTAHQLGIKTSDMLIFEDSLAGSEAAAKSGASLIVIWDGQTAKRLFPQEAQLFITDFVELAKNLDYTGDEEIELFKKRLAEEEANRKSKLAPITKS